MSETTCIVCESKCQLLGEGVEATKYHTPVHDCPRCGKYIPVGPAQEPLRTMLTEGKIDRSVLSHLIRNAQREKPLVIYPEDLTAYSNEGPLPTPREQLENLILWIGDNQKFPGTHVFATREELAATVGSRISNGESAFYWLLQENNDKGLYRPHPTGLGSEGRPGFFLSMEGWNLYEQLRQKRLVSRTAFMAMKFGDSTLEDVVETYFKPAVAKAGFELRSLTEGQGAGLIDNQIRAAIRAARFVVADLTHDNNGAYFEAGFAEGLGLPVIYTCEAEKFQAKKTHFDTNHMMTVPWDVADLDDAAKRLTATVRNTLPAEAIMSDD